MQARPPGEATTLPPVLQAPLPGALIGQTGTASPTLPLILYMDTMIVAAKTKRGAEQVPHSLAGGCGRADTTVRPGHALPLPAAARSPGAGRHGGSRGRGHHMHGTRDRTRGSHKR
jgi:hypothetical protein